MNFHIIKDTKTSILDTAEELILTRGYNGFSYRDIAEVVGIRKASIHHHFATKKVLGATFVDRYAHRFENWCQLVTHQSVAQKLTSFLEMFKHLSNNAQRVCPLSILTAEYPTLPQSMQDKLRILYGDIDQWLVGVLTQGQREGALKPAPEAAIMAKVIFNAMSASLKMARVFQDVDQLEQVFNALTSMILLPNKPNN